MKKAIPRIMILMLAVCTSFAARAQTNDEASRVVEQRLIVDSTLEEAWNALSDFNGVDSFHVLYDEVVVLTDESDSIELGAERESFMPDGNYNVILQERVVELDPGSYYTFEMINGENTAVKRLRVTYGVRLDESGRTELFSITRYNMGSGVRTNLARGRFNRDSRNSLISFKYFIETGKGEKDLKRLLRWYEQQDSVEETGDVVALRAN